MEDQRRNIGVEDGPAGMTCWGCCGMQEELRALRTAVQLMVKRTEESDARQPSSHPATSTMEPIQECSSEADASGDIPMEECAQEGAQGGPDSPKSHAPCDSAEVSTGLAMLRQCRTDVMHQRD